MKVPLSLQVRPTLIVSQVKLSGPSQSKYVRVDSTLHRVEMNFWAKIPLMYRSWVSHIQSHILFLLAFWSQSEMTELMHQWSSLSLKGERLFTSFQWRSKFRSPWHIQLSGTKIGCYTEPQLYLAVMQELLVVLLSQPLPFNVVSISESRFKGSCSYFESSDAFV